MNISGSATMHAPAGDVWGALTDPAVLAAAIPGCELLERAEDGSWRFAITISVASSGGILTGTATASDRQDRASVTVLAAASGPGAVTATIGVGLTPGAGDTTELSYELDANVGGQLASVGQLLLTSAAGRTASQFVTALDQILTRNGAVSVRLASAVEPDPAPDPRLLASAREPAARPGARTVVPGVVAGGVVGGAAGLVAAWLAARRRR
jgi:uncharacterized protein